MSTLVSSASPSRGAHADVHRGRSLLRIALLLAALASLAGCAAGPPETLSYREVARYPHDTAAFTQGLLWHDGAVYESTGLRGSSSLRRVDLESGTNEEIRFLDEAWFAEGLALVDDDTLIQLTWTGEVAFRWPLSGFQGLDGPLATHPYDGEGWGLCFDGERLVMSDGSSRLTFRDPNDLRALGGVDVTLDGEPLARLNELECVGGQVWANVWYDDRIVRIDPSDGRVTGVLDASSLLTDEERAGLSDEAVLNGIAYREERGTFLLTGKLWPVLIEVVIDEAAIEDAAP